MLVISQANLPPTDMWLTFAVFVLLASVTVIAPVAYYLIAGSRAEATLASWKTWLTHNNATVMSVLCLILGTKLLADGVQALIA